MIKKLVIIVGHLTPNKRMKQAVGAPLSNEPILKATEIAVAKMK